jgi:pyridoxamine 5'-phosphate oxidase
MDPDLAAMRRDYTVGGLTKAEMAADPITQFEAWFETAKQGGVHEPNGMVLATVDADGQPSSRVVLLKIVDQRGLAFFTNLESRKGRALAANRKAAATFWWGPLERQVRFEGVIEPVAAAEADTYFQSRPEGSRIGAWASPQSRVIENRTALEALEQAATARFAGGTIPRPPHWGGYRLVPHAAEFWQGRQNRLHDRFRYHRAGDGWTLERLAP